MPYDRCQLPCWTHAAQPLGTHEGAKSKARARQRIPTHHLRDTREVKGPVEQATRGKRGQGARGDGGSRIPVHPPLDVSCTALLMPHACFCSVRRNMHAATVCAFNAAHKDSKQHFFLKWECRCCKRKPCMWVLGGSRGRQFKDLELSSGIERWGLWLLTPIRGEPVGS